MLKKKVLAVIGCFITMSNERNTHYIHSINAVICEKMVMKTQIWMFHFLFGILLLRIKSEIKHFSDKSL